jgi:hypothetical protein
LVPPEVDLRDFGFMPLDVLRLRDSDLAALSTGDEFKAAVLLWCAAWHQVPAGSLPDDDRLLARFSGAGSLWKKVKDEALRGFVKCSDGRLYHRTIAEKALESWAAKQRQRERTAAATAAREAKRRAALGLADDHRNDARDVERNEPRDEERNEPRDEERNDERDVQRDVVQGTGTVKGQGQGQGKKEKTQGAVAPPFVLPDWVPSEDWQAFDAMRKQLRKPMTARARELVIRELDRLRSQGHAPGAVLQQSIRKSWQDVYPLKPDQLPLAPGQQGPNWARSGL